MRSRGVTVLLVTHAVHFLARVDYIYAMKGGKIVESGTYDELMSRGGEFARLNKEYGGHSQDPVEHRDGDTVKVSVGDGNKLMSQSDTDSSGVKTAGPMTQDIATEAVKLKAVGVRKQAAVGTGKLEGRLMVKEQRSTGSISRKGVFSHTFSCTLARVLVMC